MLNNQTKINVWTEANLNKLSTPLGKQIKGEQTITSTNKEIIELVFNTFDQLKDIPNKSYAFNSPNEKAKKPSFNSDIEYQNLCDLVLRLTLKGKELKLAFTELEDFPAVYNAKKGAKFTAVQQKRYKDLSKERRNLRSQPTSRLNKISDMVDKAEAEAILKAKNDKLIAEGKEAEKPKGKSRQGSPYEQMEACKQALTNKAKGKADQLFWIGKKDLESFNKAINKVFNDHISQKPTN